MKILYLGYWGAEEGLSVATIYPHLQVLAEFGPVEKIFYLSIERHGLSTPLAINIPKVVHQPLVSNPQTSVVLNKWDDFIRFPRQLADLVEREKIDLMICRCSPAGILGFLVHRKTGVPYWVESYEPHAEYMLEAGVWSRMDLRYLVERIGEGLQRKTAAYLMPASEGYRLQLLKKGAKADKVITLPCTVDAAAFAPDAHSGSSLRQQLGIATDTYCGIYVGKFGGLYFDEEAFRVFSEARKVLGKFFLIVLSPQPSEEIRARLLKWGFSEQEFVVRTVPHREVPAYLHAADFAFSNIRPIASQRYSSPIKTGEYWAAGLPILHTKGVGDESDVIAGGAGGVLMELENVQEALQQMKALLKTHQKEEVMELARKYRGRSLIKQVYEQAFGLVPVAVQERLHIQ